MKLTVKQQESLPKNVMHINIHLIEDKYIHEGDNICSVMK